jgi:hypothetical protein
LELRKRAWTIGVSADYRWLEASLLVETGKLGGSGGFS